MILKAVILEHKKNIGPKWHMSTTTTMDFQNPWNLSKTTRSSDLSISGRFDLLTKIHRTGVYNIVCSVELEQELLISVHRKGFPFGEGKIPRLFQVISRSTELLYGENWHTDNALTHRNTHFPPAISSSDPLWCSLTIGKLQKTFCIIM